MIQRFCLHVRLNKLQHVTGIWLPILYHEINKDDTILVQGWVSDTTTSTWHVWCESCSGIKVDPHVKLLEMDGTFYNLEYSSEEPVTFDKDDETVASWELYEKSPQMFWKAQTPAIRSFRSKLNSLIKNNKY